MTTTKYQDARDRIKKARDEAASLMQEAFKEAANEIFAKYPGLQAFRWNQYTPYFNDGDSCEFGVYGDEPDMLATGSNDWENGDEVGSDYNYTPNLPDKFPKKKPEELHPMYAAQKEVVSLLGGFDAEDMLTAFGDHVEVTVDRDEGVEKDEYEHD